ncbi:MAG: Asp-tRNA(Asn)/Glu-tRNA(Gln) amidotransferase subunit GatB, partial [Anaerolineae bacterium]
MTASKMFCGCSAAYDGAEPNTLVCPVCLGLPGSLPVPNARAVELTVRTGLALGCEVATTSHFDRKNYHYPDLPKGYQISQSDAPLCVGGRFPFADDDGTVTEVRIERVHLEEDTAKLLHAGDASLVDFNRAGVPLMEVVTHPDLRTPDQASDFLESLRQLLRWLGVSTGNMEAGALRADVNVSVRRIGTDDLGVKVEVKNLNSFAAVKAALAYESLRLAELAEAGATIPQETRGWSDADGRSYGQRSKEFAADYRYFPEPDIPPLVLDKDLID